MLTWGGVAAVVAILLVAGRALYVRFRWHRSPRAYRAMFALAACYFVAGALAGGWMALILSAPKPAASLPPSTADIPSIPAPLASAAAAAAAALSNPLSHFSAKVVSITDGDTV